MNLLWILLAFCLVLVNAFFVAAEFGMVKLRASRVEEIKNTRGLRGRVLFHVHKHLDAYLSACQLGITFASLGLGWIGEPAFTQLLEPVFRAFGIMSPKLSSLIAFFLAFSLISFLHIVIGELMPKSLAIRQSENVSLWTAVPLYGFYWIMYPAISFLNGCSNFFLKRFGLAGVHHGEHLYSSDEIMFLLNTSHLHGEFTKEEVDIIERTMDFADMNVTEVMRLADEMVMINLNQSIDQIMALMTQHRYTRYPVYDPDKKEVIGLVHVKDVLPMIYMAESQEITSDKFRALLRPVLNITRQVRTLDLLRQFREGMPLFALVYSQQGALIGFITLDNLLQVLVGRIKDEFHRTQIDWTLNEDGSITATGSCSIYSLEQAMNRDFVIDVETESNIETLNGLIVHRLGYVPKKGECIILPECGVFIEDAIPTRILKVMIYPKG